MLLAQGLGLVQGGFPGFHGVDQVAFDLLQVLVRQVALQGVDAGGADQGPLTAGDHLDALGAGVGALVVLAGEGFHRQDRRACRHDRQVLIVAHVALGLGKNTAAGGGIGRLVDALGIVAVQQPQAGQICYAEGAGQILQQGFCLYIEALSLLRVAAEYISHS